MNNIDTLIQKAFWLLNKNQLNELDDLIASIFNDEHLLNNLTNTQWQYIGNIAMSAGKFHLAKSCFVKANDFAGTAFVLILTKKISEAKLVLENCPSSPAKNWCEFLIEIFSGVKNLKTFPTFLQVRHFLEMTVTNLLLGKNEEYLQFLKNKLNILTEINIDAEKLFGYAYFNYGEKENALKILNHAVEKNRFDGEIYFFISKIYYHMNSFDKALSMIENANYFMPNYLPSVDFKNKILSRMNQLV